MNDGLSATIITSTVYHP